MLSHEIPVSAISGGAGATGAPIRVLIADDHAILRLGLRALLATEPDMEVVGEAVDGTDAVHKARCLRPDVIVLDLVMPRQDGLQATAEITQEDPGAADRLRRGREARTGHQGRGRGLRPEGLGAAGPATGHP
jgi:PleD family two-component response regulator